ncbi:hypothetical protein ABMA27_013554 [Loxostege sticticalis]
MEGFVIQGNKTHIRHYPHSVYLNIICTRITYICGGSILNQRVVLTAGHCLEDCTGKYRDEVYLKYGHENPSQMGSTQMKRFIMHERYDGNSLDNDIALVSGKRNIPLGKTVRRIAIFRSPPRQRLAYMAGWGVMNYRNDVALTLLDTVQEMQPNKVCKLLGTMPRGTFCAGSIKGPGNPDRGDSGSALVVKKYVQIGLVSYKVDHYSLVVYTNVSYFYSWIRNNAHKLYCSRS